MIDKHEDVHRLVYRLAVESGAQVDFGVSVESVKPGNPKPSVTLSTGEVLTADIIIGADGPRSLVRPVVLDRDDDAKPSGFSVFGTTIPAEEMMKDPELAKLVQANEVRHWHSLLLQVLIDLQWPIMMGNNRSLCGKLSPARDNLR